MSFEKYSELLIKSFQTLNESPDQRYSEHRKVEKVILGFKPESQQLSALCGFVDHTFHNNFSGAVAYLGQQVARVYGPTILERKRLQN